MGGEDASSQPILIPESAYGEVQQDIAQANDGRGISISNSQLVFQPTVSGCAGSVCRHSVRSQLARNKNEIQIYVSEFGHKKGMGRHK